MRISLKTIFFAAFFAVAFISSIAAERPIVANIHAEGTNEKRIVVSWTNPQNPEPPISSLLIFRSTQPMYSYEQLETVAPTATVSAHNSDWADTVSDYRDYYYTVLAVTQQGSYSIVIPSVNATVNGAHQKLPQKQAMLDTDISAQEKLYPEGMMRETPLPYIDLQDSANSKRVQMSTVATEQAKLLAGNYAIKKNIPLEPYVFEEDLISPDGGDDFLLFDILRTTFIQKKYSEAVTSLSRLLATNRSKIVTERAQFYLGESHYFSGNYADAVTSFLQISEAYPALTKKWIDSSLDFIQLPE